MKISYICMFIGIGCMTGCASSLKTYDDQRNPSVGVPVATPVLVKITEQTTYKTIDEQRQYAKYCTPEINIRLDYLALGERSFITFHPAPFGKAEFALEYNESGSLKSVSLGSDASAGIEKVNELVSTVLPYFASAKTSPTNIEPSNQEKLLTQDDNETSLGESLGKNAKDMKDKFCLSEGTKVISVEKL